MSRGPYTILAPLTKPIVRTPISAIDIENDTKTSKTTLVGYKDDRGYRSFKTETSYIQWMIENHRAGEVCYAHNGSGFDFQRLLPAILSENVPYRLCLQGAKIISGTIGTRKLGWNLSDSAALYSMPLKKLGEALGLLKGDTFELEGDDLKKYNERDLDIVLEGMYNLQITAEKMGFQVKPTPAACALDYLKRHIDEKLFLPSEEWFAQSYFGGRVLLLEPEYTGPGWCADVNSLYPWAMCHELPHGKATTYKGPFSQAEARSLFGESVGFARARVKIAPCEAPPLPVRGKERILYPCGEFDGIWAFPDLMSLSPNDKIWIREVRLFKKAKPFLEQLVRDLYKLRKIAVLPSDKQAIKILLNSLYGKFCEHTKKTNLASEATSIFDDTDIEDAMDSPRFVLPDMVPIIGDKGVVFALKHIEQTRPAARSPAVGAYITAWSRRRWYELFGVLASRLLYGDTDSGYLKGRPEDYPQLPVSDELGDLKNEGEFDKFIGLAPKVYGAHIVKAPKVSDLGWHVRAKGMPMGAGFDCNSTGTLVRERVAGAGTVGPLLETGKDAGKKYAEHGEEFLRKLRAGWIVSAKRPVSFALAGNLRPGDWATVQKGLTSDASAGRIWIEGWERTRAPVLTASDKVGYTGGSYQEQEEEEDEPLESSDLSR